MKLIKYFIFLFFVFVQTNQVISQIRYWEDLSMDEQHIILNDSGTYSGAVDFYNNKFIASDDSLTENLLDTILGMETFNPLYFYDFNKIVKKSDGALSERMVDYCYLMVIYHTNEFMGYLTKDRLLKESKHYCSSYANLIGWGIQVNKNKAEREKNREAIETAIEEFKNSSSNNKETVRLFLVDIDKAIYSK